MSGFNAGSDDDDDDRSVTSEVTTMSEVSGVSALTNAVSEAGIGLGGHADDASAYGDYDGYDDFGSGGETCEHACCYCGIRDPSCMAQCVDTGKWFCNARGKGRASHIVQHLVLARKSQVALHEKGQLGDITLECYACGTKNIFNLGVVFAQKQQAMALLCREPCLKNDKALEDMEWDPSEWKPLLVERALEDWVAKVPTMKQQVQSIQLTTADITLVEKVWRDRPDAPLMEALRGDMEGEDEAGWLEKHQVGERFADGYSYQNKIAPLVLMESEEDKKLKESDRFEEVEVRWEKQGKGGKRYRATVSLPSGIQDKDSKSRVNIGDELKLSLSALAMQANQGKYWEGTGRIFRIDGDDISIDIVGGGGGSGKERGDGGKKKRHYGDKSGAGADELESVTYTADGKVVSAKIPDHINDCFIVECLWKSTSYDRMQAALKAFAIDDYAVSGALYHQLMGHEDIPKVRLDTKVPPLDVKIPTIDKDGNRGFMALPNESQAHAIEQSLQAPLSLIQGPPGTGKTFTATSIVYHLSKAKTKQQILVCAPSNVAVDHLTEKIASTGLMVVRLSAKMREDQTPVKIQHLFLHDMVANIKTEKHKQLRQLMVLRDEVGELDKKDARLFKKLYEAAEKEILACADVVCATCVGAGDPRIAKMQFRQVLIDESTQAMEAECIIPLVRGVKQLILIGDHQQLGPVVMCKKAAKAGLTRSLFERLMQLGHRPVLLNKQYRMHPVLSEWPSNCFYDGLLINGVAEEERQHECGSSLEWLTREQPLHFQVVLGVEEIASNGTSYLNRKEAECVEKLVSGLFKSGVVPEEIGVITPYEGQRAFTSAWMKGNGSNLNKTLYDAVEVASVDAFQGREKDFIILSCVRSNETQGIGFLKDGRRLNVALTRARYGVFVLGNPNVLAKNHMWNHLLRHYQDRGALVEGPLSNLRVASFRIPHLKPRNDPQDFSRDRSQGNFGGGYGGYGGGGVGNFGEGAQGQGQGQEGNRNWSEAMYESYGNGGNSNNENGVLATLTPVVEPVTLSMGSKKDDSRNNKRYKNVISTDGNYHTDAVNKARAEAEADPPVKKDTNINGGMEALCSSVILDGSDPSRLTYKEMVGQFGSVQGFCMAYDLNPTKEYDLQEALGISRALKENREGDERSLATTHTQHTQHTQASLMSQAPSTYGSVAEPTATGAGYVPRATKY